jgi:benzoyl-CoA reductase/2-hydroxyglutaryl-CoA dehydratase subunit BcrC/BadD/HgdB
MAIEDFRHRLGAEQRDVEQWKKRLDGIRRKLIRLDTLTWKTRQVTGEENHRFLVASSDFDGDPDGFEGRLDAFLDDAAARPIPKDKPQRIGVIGVPTIFTDLYPYLDSRGGTVVFNEVQRQFSMPSLAPDLATQFENYTYPFELRFRIADIKAEVQRRNIAGIVHYIQSFCHRQIEDIVIREEVGVPVLTVEGDRPGLLDGRSKTRIDAFLEMLRER